MRLLALSKYQAPILVKRNLLGFTLLELMVSVALLGIVAAIAGPTFVEMSNRANVRKTSDNLSTSIQQARADAIKWQLIITMEPVAQDWNKGWEVTTSTNESVRVFTNQKSTIQSTVSKLTFNPSGIVRVTCTSSSCNEPQFAIVGNSIKRTIAVYVLGKTHVKEVGVDD